MCVFSTTFVVAYILFSSSFVYFFFFISKSWEFLFISFLCVFFFDLFSPVLCFYLTCLCCEVQKEAYCLLHIYHFFSSAPNHFFVVFVACEFSSIFESRAASKQATNQMCCVRRKHIRKCWFVCGRLIHLYRVSSAYEISRPSNIRCGLDYSGV